jgi:hypothetical protein
MDELPEGASVVATVSPESPKGDACDNGAARSTTCSGWSPWRSAEQVVDSIGDSPELERLLSRIYRRQQASESVRISQCMH